MYMYPSPIKVDTATRVVTSARRVHETLFLPPPSQCSFAAGQDPFWYRATSLIRIRPPLGPYGRTMHGALFQSHEWFVQLSARFPCIVNPYSLSRSLFNPQSRMVKAQEASGVGKSHLEEMRDQLGMPLSALLRGGTGAPSTPNSQPSSHNPELDPKLSTLNTQPLTQKLNPKP